MDEWTHVLLLYIIAFTIALLMPYKVFGSELAQDTRTKSFIGYKAAELAVKTENNNILVNRGLYLLLMKKEK